MAGLADRISNNPVVLPLLDGLDAEASSSVRRRPQPMSMAIGRLRPGVTLEQASSELAALDRQFATDFDYLRRGFDIVVRPFTEVVFGDVRRTMMAPFGAVALVLLIASANVANLLLMRGESRRGELALRAMLGAGRGRMAGQVLAESLVLSVIAAIG